MSSDSIIAAATDNIFQSFSATISEWARDHPNVLLAPDCRGRIVNGLRYRFRMDEDKADFHFGEALTEALLCDSPQKVIYFQVRRWLERVAFFSAFRVHVRRVEMRRTTSLDADPVAAKQPDPVMYAELRERIDSEMGKLDPDEQKLINEVVLGRRTQAEVALELRVSKATVCRKLSWTLEKLRRSLEAHQFPN